MFAQLQNTGPGAVLADTILVAHFALVFFNVGALPLIWVGHWLKWRFVRNFYFRWTHVLLIALVVGESVFGVVCPLTAWEEQLRGGGAGAGDGRGFIAHWVHQLMFFECDAIYFTAAYIAFFILVLATFYFIPPEPRKGKTQAEYSG